LNHKRHKPKSARGGCLLCKPWKANGYSKFHRAKPRDQRQLQVEPMIVLEPNEFGGLIGPPTLQIVDGKRERLESAPDSYLEHLSGYENLTGNDPEAERIFEELTGRYSNPGFAPQFCIEHPAQEITHFITIQCACGAAYLAGGLCPECLKTMTSDVIYLRTLSRNNDATVNHLGEERHLKWEREFGK